MRLRVFAYCAEAYRPATEAAAGVPALTSPPMTAGTFSPVLLSGWDLIYFNLHGRAGEGAWYGEPAEPGPLPERVPALDAEQVAQAHLGGAVVFALNCYAPETPFLPALFAAGATALVAGEGTNYGGRTGLGSADLIGLWLRRGLSVGMTPETALSLARARVRLWPTAEREDALGFRVYRKEDA